MIMKQIKNIFIALACVCTLAGCDKFLNVNPKGEVFDQDMFTSAEGYEDALYGIYAELGTTQYLYSDYMVWVPEVMGVNLQSSSLDLTNVSMGLWDAYGAPGLRKGIWSAAYKTINHINNILGYIEKGGDDQYQYTKLYKGEALALRAMLHFDMMRLFGPPAWADASAKAKVIPYVTKYAFDITPFSSYDDVYKYIIADLEEAEKCLAADETLLPAERNNSAAGFTSCRIIHMNLYAVQALLARVYWYKGDLAKAATYAAKVIESGKFSFRPREAFIQSENGVLDMNETIFGIYSQQSNVKNAKAFGFSSSSTSLTVRDDAYAIFNDGSSASGTDLRLSAWFDGTQFKNLVNRSYVEGSNSYSGKSILGVNIFRISEMYYIMAEALMESDPATATEYYDAVVTTRDLDALTGVSTVTADVLYNERCKEFFGEGFRWFDMKRLGKDIQVSTSVLLPGNNLSTYVMPLPLAEEENRAEE